jgi:hypothetical protein
MSKPSAKRLKKKKDREKKAKEKVLARRKAIQAPKIEENKHRKKMKRIAKLQKGMGELSMWADDILGRMSNDTLTQLEKNAQILKTLESEYEKEKAKKKQINNNLEDKGLISLQEKLDHLHNELVEQQKAAGNEILKDELILAKQARSQKEVAEVSVCRVPECDSQEENK